MTAPVVASIVLDGVGVGDAPDAAAYGDEGSNTLGHVCREARPNLPNLTRLGCGSITRLDGVPAMDHPEASWGRLTQTAAGKDSTTGHWELAGVVLREPFPLYPDGFPPAVLESFCEETGAEGVLGNRRASGTAIIAELGEEHQRTGLPIVYTSGDSVFQIAANVDTISLETLNEMCRIARDRVLVGEHAVGRVIARPFSGSAGSYERLSAKRKDFALKPAEPTLQSVLRDDRVRTVAIGKVGSLFANTGFDAVVTTTGNLDGLAKTLDAVEQAKRGGPPTFIWTNLVDFDELYGHRNDPNGFARALEETDDFLPRLEAALPAEGLLLLTADHGNDPTYPGTDHTRERVPLLVTGPRHHPAPLGTRATYADHAASVAGFFGVNWDGPGTRFL